MSYLEDDIKKTDKLVEELIESKLGRKILFTGLSQSGKSSIIQTVFEGRNPEMTSDMQATIGFIRKQIDYEGISLYIFDLGGQIPYLEEAFGTLKESIFSNLSTLIFVIDAANFGEYQQARTYFLRALKNVDEFCKEAKIRLLAHKMDLIPDDEKDERLQTLSSIFDIDNLENIEIYPTSIFEKSIFEAIEKILL